jgi:hypothetical protein
MQNPNQPPFYKNAANKIKSLMYWLSLTAIVAKKRENWDSIKKKTP